MNQLYFPIRSPLITVFIFWNGPSSFSLHWMDSVDVSSFPFFTFSLILLVNFFLFFFSFTLRLNNTNSLTKNNKKSCKPKITPPFNHFSSGPFIWDVVRNFLLQDHIGQCSKFPILCPNSCGASIPREMVRLSFFFSFLSVIAQTYCCNFTA